MEVKVRGYSNRLIPCPGRLSIPFSGVRVSDGHIYDVRRQKMAIPKETVESELPEFIVKQYLPSFFEMDETTCYVKPDWGMTIARLFPDDPKLQEESRRAILTLIKSHNWVDENLGYMRRDEAAQAFGNYFSISDSHTICAGCNFLINFDRAILGLQGSFINEIVRTSIGDKLNIRFPDSLLHHLGVQARGSSDYDFFSRYLTEDLGYRSVDPGIIAIPTVDGSDRVSFYEHSNPKAEVRFVELASRRVHSFFPQKRMDLAFAIDHLAFLLFDQEKEVTDLPVDLRERQHIRMSPNEILQPVGGFEALRENRIADDHFIRPLVALKGLSFLEFFIIE